MGRNYYCDFCDKRMKNNLDIRQKHNESLKHQIARNEHYQKFKDVRIILKEESSKTVCNKLGNDECKFGAKCRFSHYTRQEMEEMKDRANQIVYQEQLATVQFEHNFKMNYSSILKQFINDYSKI